VLTVISMALELLPQRSIDQTSVLRKTWT